MDAHRITLDYIPGREKRVPVHTSDYTDSTEHLL